MTIQPMKNIQTYLKHLTLVFTFASIAAIVAPTQAESMPLDDPWIVFCLINFPADEVGDCIDGIPHTATDILKASGVQLKPKLSFEVVKPDDKRASKKNGLIAPTGDRKQMSMPFYCPDEFGPSCSEFKEAFIAIGGNCKKVDHNTVCHYP